MRIYLVDIEKSESAYSIPVTNNNRDLQYLPIGNEGEVLTIQSGQIKWLPNNPYSGCYCVTQNEVDEWNEAFSWGNHSLAGYEEKTNKANDFAVINDTTYPTTEAVWDLFHTTSAPNDGALTINTTGIATGSGTFTANQATNSIININVPPTNIGSAVSGNTVNIYSSTGTSTSFTLPSPVVPNDGILNVSFTGAVTDSFSFSANQSANTNKTIYIPLPDLSSRVPTTRNLTINGVTQNLSADRTWSIDVGLLNTTTLVANGDALLSINHPVVAGNRNIELLWTGTSNGIVRGDGTVYPIASLPSTNIGNSDLTVPNATIRQLTLSNSQFIVSGTASSGSSAWFGLSTLLPEAHIFLTTNATGYIGIGTGNYEVKLRTTHLTGNRNIQFPNSAGVIPLRVNGIGADTTGNIVVPLSGGTVTSVGITGSGALSFGGSPITTSGTFTTSWTGTTSQYIRGDGTLATFPTIPTVNNGTLTLATSGIATGSASFTANQSGNSTFTVNVPSTLSSYTNDAGFINTMPTLQQVTTAGNTSNQSITLAGTHTTTPIMTLQNNVSGTWGGSYMRFTRGNPNNYFSINNVTGTWNIPELLAYNSAATLPKMLFTAAGADNWAGNAGVIIRGQNSTLSGTMTNGTILSIRNHSTALLDVRHDGLITMSNLAGSGSRLVAADASGNLSATIAAPLSGTYSVAVTAIPANSQVTLGTATVTGTTTGDVVQIAQPLSALIYKARATAANTVTVYAINPTTSSISTTAETLNIKVIK